MGVLHLYAAPLEGDALARHGVAAVRIGVGKAHAAAGATQALARVRPTVALLFGVCGAYPQRHVVAGPALDVADLCAVGDDVLADEGVLAEDGFRDVAELGFGEVGPFPADVGRTAELARLLGGLPIVRGATVSTCSGRDTLSAEVARRTGALVETMEGAAVALACRLAGVPFVQLRCVANRTGDRARGGFALADAAVRVQDAVLRLAAAGFGEAAR
jgi:futalosine hydrolase